MADHEPTSREEDLRAELLATRELFDRYDWGEIVAVSPADPAVAPVVDDGSGAALPLIDDWDVMRLADEAAMGRALDRGEAILGDVEDEAERTALLDLLDRIEQWGATPIVLGFWWRAVEQAAMGAREAHDRGGSAGGAEPVGDGVEAIRSAAARGGADGVRGVVAALARAGDESPEALAGAALEALRGLGAAAEDLVPVFVVREALPEAAAVPLYRFALDVRAPVVTERLVRRALAALAGVTGPGGPARARDLLAIVAESGDPRGVPLLAVVLRQVDLEPEAHRTLVAILQELGLWAKVSDVLAGFKGKAPRLVPRGVSFEAYLDRMADVEKVDRKNPAELGALRERAAELWQDVYREECGWLRTRDSDVRGRREIALGRLFEAEATYLIRDERDRRAREERAALFHQEWTRRPSRASGGRAPLAVILEERIAAQPAGPLRREMRRRMLGNLVAEARTLQRRGARTLARGTLDVITDLGGPDYAPATRLRRDLA